MGLRDLETEITRREATRDRITADLANVRAKINRADEQVKIVEQAKEIIQTVGLQTQQELEFRVSEPVSLALATVFGDEAYEFALRYSVGAGQSLATPLFVRDGQEVNPLDSSGGGPVDVASFALRVGAWNMRRPRSRPVLLLDEPFRFLSTDRQDDAGDVFKVLTQALGVQVIMVTHSERLAQCADKMFRVTNIDGKSEVVEVVDG